MSRWPTHYESLPHDNCVDIAHCDCCCLGCLTERNPNLLADLRDRGYTIDPYGVLVDLEGERA